MSDRRQLERLYALGFRRVVIEMTAFLRWRQDLLPRSVFEARPRRRQKTGNAELRSSTRLQGMRSLINARQLPSVGSHSGAD